MTSKFDNSEIAAVFASYPDDARDKLLSLRQLILDTAATTEGVGVLEETLKWGQPSYLTSETKSGSTIRIDQTKAGNGQYAMYVHCQTDLIETFKDLYPRVFTYEGKRAVLFDAEDKVSSDALSHCIALALTYHLRKKSRKRA